MLRLRLALLRTQARLITTHSSSCLGHTHCAWWLRAMGDQDIVPHHCSVTGHHVVTQAAVTTHGAGLWTVDQAGAAQGSLMDGSGNGGNGRAHIAAGEGRLCGSHCGMHSPGTACPGELQNLNSSAPSTLRNRQHRRQQESYRLKCFHVVSGLLFHLPVVRAGSGFSSGDRLGLQLCCASLCGKAELPRSCLWARELLPIGRTPETAVPLRNAAATVLGTSGRAGGSIQCNAGCMAPWSSRAMWQDKAPLWQMGQMGSVSLLQCRCI